MSVGESHEHGRLIFAYKGVNGVNFCLIAQSFALSLLQRHLFSGFSESPSASGGPNLVPSRLVRAPLIFVGRVTERLEYLVFS
jgi:hypothetical protein